MRLKPEKIKEMMGYDYRKTNAQEFLFNCEAYGLMNKHGFLSDLDGNQLDYDFMEGWIFYDSSKIKKLV